VAGAGEEASHLEAMAGGTIEFVGRVSDEKRDELYSQAKALVFPGVEDFGIVPVEAQAAGCPVIAFGEGGALETVVEGKTGVFFNEPTADSLCAAIEKLDAFSASEELVETACRNNASSFSNFFEISVC
jgi:glycosyltransferase involved in cell wall biosynthesis